jgi:hypothetical protein
MMPKKLLPPRRISLDELSFQEVIRYYTVRLLFPAYALQLLTVGYWRLVPVAQSNHDSFRHSIHSGFGTWVDFVPILILTASLDMPVYLVTTDLRTGTSDKTIGYDSAEDIYAAFPVVWPNKLP